VQDLFAAAAELPADQQRRLVEEQSQGDDELRNQVFSLLRYDTGGLEIQDAVEHGARGILTSELPEDTMPGP
jgi:hypothetical protein